MISSKLRLDQLVSRVASESPEKIALVSGDERVSYGELARRTDQIATALLAAGVNSGDRVATLQAPCPDFVVALLATASIGAIWIGLNPRYRLPELRRIVRDAAPKILLTRLKIADRSYITDIAELQECLADDGGVVFYDSDGSDMPPLRAGSTSFDVFKNAGKTISSEQLHRTRLSVGDRDPCVIVYTSGSTGAPKGALLHHAGIMTFSHEQNRLWPVSPLRMLNYFPINHIGCVVDVTLPCLEAGGTVVFLEQFDVVESLRLMQREGITVWGSVPSVFAMQLDHPALGTFDLSAVQLIVWEGAAMPPSRVAQLCNICPRLATNYGMTETTSAITALRPTDCLGDLTETVGPAFPNVSIDLIDVLGNQVPVGEIGEVCVRSDNNFLGYWNNPQATRSAFTERGYFRTGDLASQRSDGFYEIHGRIKNMFKSGGYNVYPEEVERVIEGFSAVRAAAVVGIEDPLWQEVGVAFVTLDEPVSADEISNWCRDHLANYKIPKRFFIVAELPLLPVGKVDRLKLREWAIRDPESTSSGPKP